MIHNRLEMKHKHTFSNNIWLHCHIHFVQIEFVSPLDPFFGYFNQNLFSAVLSSMRNIWALPKSENGNSVAQTNIFKATLLNVNKALVKIVFLRILVLVIGNGQTFYNTEFHYFCISNWVQNSMTLKNNLESFIFTKLGLPLVLFCFCE